MIRLGLVYLAMAVLIVGAIAGLPDFGWFSPASDHSVPAQAASLAPDAAPSGSQADAAAAAATASAAALIQAATARPAALPAVEGDFEAITAAILADLTGGKQPVAASPVSPEDAALSDMSQAALKSLRALKGADAVGAGALAGLVAQALREGESDAFIDALLNEAVGRGEVSVPGAMLTTEGKVDTAVLLASLVTKAQGAEVGEGDTSTPDAVPSTDPLARFLASEDLLYTVEVGDSLGSLALRFYGDAGRYQAIFAANRDKLSAPDRVSAGLRLVIPALSRL